MKRMHKALLALFAGLSVPVAAGLLSALPARKGGFSPGDALLAVLSGALAGGPWLTCLIAILCVLGALTGARVRRRSLADARLRRMRYAVPAILIVLAAVAAFASLLSTKNPAAHCGLLDIAGAMAMGRGCEDSQPPDPYGAQHQALFAAGILVAAFGIGFAAASLRSAGAPEHPHRAGDASR